MAMKFVADKLIIKIADAGQNINLFIREAIEEKLERTGCK